MSDRLEADNSPPLIAKRTRKAGNLNKSCESNNVFHNNADSIFFETLATLVELTTQGKNNVGSLLATALNRLGEKIELLTRENISLKAEVTALAKANKDRIKKTVIKNGLDFWSELISDLSSCTKTVSIVQANLGHIPDSKPLNFLRTKSSSINKGLIITKITTYKGQGTSSNRNIDVVCRTLLEKKHLEFELKQNDLSIRKMWPKKLLGRIRTLRNRYSDFYKGGNILIRLNEASSGLNVYRKETYGGWVFCEHINLPTSIELSIKESPFRMTSNKIVTHDIFCDS